MAILYDYWKKALPLYRFLQDRLKIKAIKYKILVTDHWALLKINHLIFRGIFIILALKKEIYGRI